MITSETISEYPSLESIGPSLRSLTKGPEHSLVVNYIDSKITPYSDEWQVIFLEPRVDACFPDIVIVYFDTNISENWSRDRAKLVKSDIRILHYIFTNEVVTLSQLNTFFPKGVSSSLKRLHEAKVIEWIAGDWRAKPLHEIFAIKKLVAIEAKISNWQQGLQQAFHNSWFASESYLLLQHMPRRTTLLQQAENMGVGVLMPHQCLDKPEISAQVERMPKSYASWLFNEWAWRAKLAKN
ncbi:hypothetical protein NDA01_27590 [Trichocoleus desertorum AS-A10]|uniref:hypothetical protein n=1 Tax=Trichocoleus desertorum TaxID=1481672 RepID=UPI003297B2BC